MKKIDDDGLVEISGGTDTIQQDQGGLDPNPDDSEGHTGGNVGGIGGEFEREEGEGGKNPFGT